MTPNTVILFCALFGVLMLAASAGLCYWMLRAERTRADERADELADALLENLSAMKRDLGAQIFAIDARQAQSSSALIDFVTREQRRSSDAVVKFSAEARSDLSGMQLKLGESIRLLQGIMDERFSKLLTVNAEASERMGARVAEELKEIRTEMGASLERVRADNAEKLEAMRETVQEKLEKTLSERLAASFRMVDDKLGLVQTGLGEMRRMAESVTKLQAVLANVKTRGIFGETQLEALLSEILAPGQWASQVQLDPQSGNRVDFAVRMPGRGSSAACWLPIDAKFPLEDWELLQTCEAEADASGAKEARRSLERAVLRQAKSIREKYVMPPATTEFAVMYLPAEGLYAEVLRAPGLFERLQREFRITPAGPVVIAALLNSLLMGFMTLAMEKRSAEVWTVLGQVKTEFMKFADALDMMEKRVDGVKSAIAGVRTRTNVMGRKLRDVEELPGDKKIDTVLPSNESED